MSKRKKTDLLHSSQLREGSNPPPAPFDRLSKPRDSRAANPEWLENSACNRSKLWRHLAESTGESREQGIRSDMDAGVRGQEVFLSDEAGEDSLKPNSLIQPPVS